MGQQVLIDSDSLTAIGDAIRKKTNQVIKYKPAEMPAAINSINSLKLGGYKVNITQSDHQTIHVTQSTFSDQESGFTIEDHPTINISLTADPGYIAGSLNLTNFTFSNDVREVDIFATPATYSPNITYNGNMNVFVCTSILGSMFNITTGTKKDSVIRDEYTYNEAFALSLVNNGENGWERLSINYKDNFYNLDPNANYKITALKIGDTSLSDTDLSYNYGGLNISSTDTNVAINANTSSDWAKSVYKQCTGKELELSYVDSISPEDLDDFMQNGTPSNAKDAYIGEQIANTIFHTESKPATNKFVLEIDTEPYHNVPFLNFYYSLSEDERKKYDEDTTAFVNKFNSNHQPGFRDGNLVQVYYYKLQEIMQKHTGDETALNVFKKYNPATNSDFVSSGFTNPNPDIFSMTYYIDPSDKYGFLASLPGGYAYVEWLFFVRYVTAEILLETSKFAGFTPIFEPADPIISTIPVSITFTNVTQ